MVVGREEVDNVVGRVDLGGVEMGRETQVGYKIIGEFEPIGVWRGKMEGMITADGAI